MAKSKAKDVTQETQAAPDYYAMALEAAGESGVKTLGSLLGTAEYIPFGVFCLDWLLLPGGVPPGRVIELFGPESSGKSTLAYRFIGNAQRHDPKHRPAMIVETEGSLEGPTVDWAVKQGADPKTMLAQPDTLEEAMTIIKRCVTSGAFSCVVLDSLAGSGPEGLVNDEAMVQMFGTIRQPGQEARASSEFSKVIMQPCLKNKTTLVIVNQVREKLKLGKYGATGETTPGGHSLHHMMALRLRLARYGSLYEGGSSSGDDDGYSAKPVVGVKVGATVRKCKFAPDGRRTGVDTPGPIELMFYAEENNFHEAPDILWAAENVGIVQKRGAWYSWDDKDVKGQGVLNFEKKLTDEGLWGELKEKTVALLSSGLKLVEEESL